VAAIATLAAAPAALAGGNGNGPDGKVTICHRTGSETNPIVVITISKNALPAHLRHGDGFFFKGKCFFFHKK
jgi:hypothetical protein